MDSLKENQSRVVKRISRYGRVSTSVAGLATKLAGEKFLGIKIDADVHADQLAGAMGNLKGPLMKIGQILSTIPEALPPEYAEAFQQLQANAPSMGWVFVKRRMKTELGADWQSKFKSFDQQAIAAASLGQVHKAVTHEGQIIACKLQYPDMRSAIDADLKQLKMIFSLYGKYDSSISTKFIHEELSARLYEELDYVREAKQTKLYAYILKDELGVHVPEIVDDLSTGRLLTSEWLEGKKILDFKDADQNVRNEIALNMFRAWYVPFYHYGIIHGDPHLGNYTVREDLSLNLLDFGCVRVFRPEFIKGVIDLYSALMNDDDDQLRAAFDVWGFENLNEDLLDALKTWALFLYAPVMDDKVRKIGEVTNGIFGKEIAQDVHAKLKEHGGITIPREFVFMDRAALGLGSVFLHLKAEINWYQVFNELIQGFDVEKLRQQQSEVLQKFDLPAE